VITAGTTQALALLSTSIATPGDIVLVAAETYDLARLIFVDAGLTVVSVAVDADGVVPEQLTRQIAETRRAGGTLAFVYLTPTFANPTGIVYPADRRRELLNVARDHSVTIVEDDAYADTGFEGAQPTTMSGLAGRKGVIRLGSFSKSLGPGLRLGWMVADREVALETTARGSFVSGGCVNHTTSGIGVAPGSRYTGRTTSATPRIRLSYSYNDPASLAQAGHTLAEAWLPLSTKGRS
jgi:2-aminoadipate transaminase